MEQSLAGWEEHIFDLNDSDLRRASETPSEAVQTLPVEIRALPYYHGFWPRKDAEDMCIEPGDFLVRRVRIRTLPWKNSSGSLNETFEELLNTSIEKRKQTPRRTVPTLARQLGQSGTPELMRLNRQPDRLFMQKAAPSNQSSTPERNDSKMASRKSGFEISGRRRPSLHPGASTANQSLQLSHSDDDEINFKRHFKPKSDASGRLRMSVDSNLPLALPRSRQLTLSGHNDGGMNFRRYFQCESKLSGQGFPSSSGSSSAFSSRPKALKFANEWGIALTVRVTPDHVEHIAFMKLPNGKWKISRNEQTGDLAAYFEHCYKAKQPVIYGDGERVYLSNPIPKCNWLYPHERIRMSGRPVGSGSFGTVFQGFILIGENRALRTAVKCLPYNQYLTVSKEVAFVEEAKIMRLLEHPHIVKFRGIAIQEIPLMLLMEWCENGDLQTALFDYGKSWSLEEHLRYALHAARGLSYLASRGIIHRDIAARNCLFDSSWVLKIADFGLSRNAEILQMKHDLNPIWQSPESLEDNIFSTKTDVWSYGVLLFEIYSNGSVPYRGHDNQAERKIAIINGEKPSIPKLMPSNVAQIMTRCHETNPENRPSFEEIRQKLEDLYSDH